MNNYDVQELNEMEFAILTVMMLLVAGVLMCYVGYLNSAKTNKLQKQLELVEIEIDNCNHQDRLKKLIALRRKLKRKIDNI